MSGGAHADMGLMNAPLCSTQKSPGRVTVACFLLLLLAPHSVLPQEHASFSGIGEKPLRPRELALAERVLHRLDVMLGATSGPEGASALRTAYKKFYPDLLIDTAGMRDGDLKTELDTAVFIFERLARDWQMLGGLKANCEAQRGDTYLPLCLGLHDGSERGLLLAKAKLHTRWGRALVKHARGLDDAATHKLLSELKEARRTDLIFADAALAHCRRLGLLFKARTASAGSDEDFVGLAEDTLLRKNAAQLINEADLYVASLPRSSLRYRLEAALAAYRDGLFWLDRLGRTAARVIPLDKMIETTHDRLGTPPESVRAALSANLIRGRRYTNKAESALLEARRALQLVLLRELFRGVVRS